MRLTVVLDNEAPDDEAGRRLLAQYLFILAVGHNKYIPIKMKEGDVRDEKGVAVGHWKIDP
jgi:hypothetical protein